MRMSDIKFLSRSNYRNNTWDEHPAFPSKAVAYRDWIKERHAPYAELLVFTRDVTTNEVTFIPEERWSDYQ